MSTETEKQRMRSLNNKRRDRILAATNNGRCWWLYQMLMYNSRLYRKS